MGENQFEQQPQQHDQGPSFGSEDVADGVADHDTEGNEDRERTEKLAVEASAEVHLKQDELRPFFGSRDEDMEIEILGQGTENLAFFVRKTMVPTDEERLHVPEGAQLEVVVRGERRNSGNKNEWDITRLKISVGDVAVTDKEILPQGTTLKLRPGSNSYDTDKKEVRMNSLANMSDVAMLFHEAGHAYDYEENPRTEDEIPQGAVFQLEHQFVRSENTKLRKALMTGNKRERQAWANGHRIAKKAGLPLQELIRSRSQYALGTYDVAAVGLLSRGDTSEFFASSEQRKSMRSPERQSEARYAHALAEEASELRNLIENVLDEPMDKVVDGQEVCGRKSYEFVFADQENGRGYKIGIERGNKVVITELTKNDDGSNTTRAMKIYGARGAAFKEIRSQRVPSVEGKQQQGPETTFEGTITVLAKEGGSNKPDQVHEKATETIRHLTEKSALEAMVIAAFKERHPDAPNPPMQGESGQDLSIEEKLEYMKKRTGSFAELGEQKKAVEDIMERLVKKSDGDDDEK